MPAFHVTLPVHPGHTIYKGANQLVVFAGSSAAAIDAAQAEFPGLDAMWGGATATEIVAGTSLQGYEFHVHLNGASPAISHTVLGNAIAISGATVDTAGTGYSVNDILTVAGGTATRAATFRVVTVGGGGEVTSVQLVDPGLYTVAPTLANNAVTDTGAGSGCLLDLVQADPYGYEVFLSQMVQALNGDAQIAGSKVDFSSGGAGTRLFTISDIADALGDLTVVAQIRKEGAPIEALIGTIVDGGIAAAVLTFAIPATVTLPRVILVGSAG